MEKFTRSFERFKKAYSKFREIVDNKAIPEILSEDFLVEITTKRFEYTYESLWKTLKEFLKIQGVECNSPRSCFKEALKEGIIEEKFERLFYDLIVIRNILVHIYEESQAKAICKRIKTPEILEAFQSVIKNLEEQSF